jgi:hypothetical protein
MGVMVSQPIPTTAVATRKTPVPKTKPMKMP